MAVSCEQVHVVIGAWLLQRHCAQVIDMQLLPILLAVLALPATVSQVRQQRVRFSSSHLLFGTQLS